MKMTKKLFEDYVSGSHSEYGVESLIKKYPILNQLGLADEFKAWYLNNGTYFEGPDPNGLQADTFEFIQNRHLLTEEIGGGLCFNNSQRIITSDPRFSYFEGFYCRQEEEPHKPIHEHGFNVKENQVMDFTSALNPEIKPFLYFGIAIPFDYVEKCLIHTLGEASKILKDKTMISLTVSYFLHLHGYDLGTRENNSLKHIPSE